MDADYLDALLAAPAINRLGPGAYYNEFDKGAANWIRELIKVGAIAPGEVDDRDIRDVTWEEIKGFVQHHFFAGIGGWSYALRLSGWSDDRPIWSASCPCQPFSAAGKGEGFDDERHVWPSLFHLINVGKPQLIVGEQVASPDGLGWLDLVQSDMEGSNHAFSALDLCAAGFGTPGIRQRLYWFGYSLAGRIAPSRWLRDAEPFLVADTTRRGKGRKRRELPAPAIGDLRAQPGQGDDRNADRSGGADDGLADTRSEGSPAGSFTGVHCGSEVAGSRSGQSERRGDVVALADAPSLRHVGWRSSEESGREESQSGRLCAIGQRDSVALADTDADRLDAWLTGEQFRQDCARSQSGDVVAGHSCALVMGDAIGSGDLAEPGDDAGAEEAAEGERASYRSGVDIGSTGSLVVVMANGESDGRGQERALDRGVSTGNGSEGRSARFESSGVIGDDGSLGDTLRERLEGLAGYGYRAGRWEVASGSIAAAGPTNGFWRDAEWLYCRDEKWRPVEPSAFPLAHGLPARVGRLRGYGNAINAEAAKEWLIQVREEIDQAELEDLFG